MGKAQESQRGGACGEPQTPERYDIELRVNGREDRKLVAAILVDNGYDVGFHKKKRTPTGKAVDYYIHATEQDRTRTGTEEEQA